MLLETALRAEHYATTIVGATASSPRIYCPLEMAMGTLVEVSAYIVVVLELWRCKRAISIIAKLMAVPDCPKVIAVHSRCRVLANRP